MVIGTGAWIGITAGVVVLGSLIYYYNRFVILENRIKNSLAQIDVQLKKRADLVPSLVKVVKGFAKHEAKIMADVTKARAEMLKAGNRAKSQTERNPPGLVLFEIYIAEEKSQPFDYSHVPLMDLNC